MKVIKKWGIFIVSFMFLCVIAVLVLLGLKSINEYKLAITDKDTQIDEMQTFIDDTVGPLVDCYVLNESVRVGDEVTEDCLSLISLPEKVAYTTETIQVEKHDSKGQMYYDEEKETTMNLVTDINDVLGKKFRIDIDEGSLLMQDFVVDDPVAASDRYYQVILSDFPTNIQVGDYVDIRIQFTYGEDFISIPHKRVEEMDLSNGLFTFIFDENDISVYNSMLLDKALYPAVSIYMLKYVDSSSQTAAEEYYPVNDNISEILAVNPNILDAVKEQMTLERAKLNSILGGDITTFDEKRLEDVNEYLEDTREDISKDKSINIKARLKDEEEQAKIKAKAEASAAKESSSSSSDSSTTESSTTESSTAE